MLQSIYKITNNKLYVKWTTLLASSTIHSTLHHQTSTINLTSLFHQPGPNNGRYQIHRATCSVRKPLEKCRRHCMSYSQTHSPKPCVEVPGWHPRLLRPHTPAPLPRHTPERPCRSSSNILSYTYKFTRITHRTVRQQLSTPRLQDP